MTDQVQAAHPPAGWYPDPTAPGRERWWSGSAWTEHDHRAARPGMFGVEYARSFWPGANASARRALLMQRISALLLLAAIVTLVVTAGSGTVLAGNLAAGFATVLVCSAGFAVATLVFAIRGLRASGSRGAFGLSVQSVIAAVVLILWTLSWAAFFLAPVVLGGL